MDDDDRDVVPVDGAYLSDVLTRARDLAELKLVLCALAVAAQEGKPFVPVEGLRRPEVARVVCEDQSPEPVEVRLERVLTQAVANGFLLRVAVVRGERTGTYV